MELSLPGYCVLVDTTVVSFHTQDTGDQITTAMKSAMAAIEKRFGKYYRPIGIETRQFEKKPCQTGVIGIEQPAWIRELHARFGESRSGESISKSELRYQA